MALYVVLRHRRAAEQTYQSVWADDQRIEVIETPTEITEVLHALDRETKDRVDAVFALLDDINPNFFFEAAQKGLKFCDGASTAHIACHVGVLQRNSTKLDREGRDYWLKPLWEIGALEKLYFDPDTGGFMPGHPVPKSPNSAYRISPAFIEILKASDTERPALLKAWATEDATRARLQVQATLAEATRAKVGTPASAAQTVTFCTRSGLPTR